MRKLRMNELNRLSTDEFKKAKKIPVTVVLDNVRSMFNVGSVFRTCDAFKVQRVFLCGLTPVPPHQEIHKTALGATESVDWEYFDKASNALEKLQGERYSIWAVEQTDISKKLNEHQFKATKTALIFGNEVKGVNKNLFPYCEGAIEIPQFGTKHSLNIAVSAGIVIWESCLPHITK